MSTSPTTRNPMLVRLIALVLGLAVALPLGAGPADARFGGGGSFGSRGARTFSMPSATPTAPGPAFPIGRSETPGFARSMPGFARPRFGFGHGLAAGLLGAGLFGLLTGHGFFGGIGGLGSLLGLLLQIALIVFAVRFALNLFRSRGAAYAGAAPSFRQAAGGFAPGSAAGRGFGAGAPIQIGPDDYAAFERLLSEVQYAAAREDTQAMSRIATPEMVRASMAEIDANRGRNLRNDMAEIRLLQGDLAEAWREESADYATVAMRFSARDTMLDRRTGRVVSGDPSRPVEATELWTFRRDSGGPWLLSAIQQAR